MHKLTKGSLTNYLDTNKMEYQEIYTLNMSEMPSEVEDCLHSVKHMEQIMAVKSVTYGGITYSSGLCVTLGQNGDLLSFGYIKEAFIINRQSFLHCDLMETVDYSVHFHSYKVRKSCRETVINIHQLPDPHPNSAYQISEHLFFVNVKYHVVL